MILENVNYPEDLKSLRKEQKTSMTGKEKNKFR